MSNPEISPGDGEVQLLEQVRSHLERVQAAHIRTALDPAFEPESGVLLKVSFEQSEWHLVPQEFLHLLEQLPHGAGADRIRQAIESDALRVWRGPSPEGSRDTTR